MLSDLTSVSGIGSLQPNLIFSRLSWYRFIDVVKNVYILLVQELVSALYTRPSQVSRHCILCNSSIRLFKAQVKGTLDYSSLYVFGTFQLFWNPSSCGDTSFL